MISTYLLKRVILPVILSLIVIFPSALLSQNNEKVNEEINQLWTSINNADKGNLAATKLSNARKIYSLANNINSYQEMILAADAIINSSIKIDWRNKEQIIKEFTEKITDFKDPLSRGVYKSLMLKHSLPNTKSLWRSQILELKDLFKQEERAQWSRVIESQPYMSNYKSPSLYEFVLLNLINSMDWSDFQHSFPINFRSVVNIHALQECKEMSNFLFTELLAQQKNNPNNYLLTKLMQLNTRSMYEGWNPSSVPKKQEYLEIIDNYKEYSNVTLFVKELAIMTRNELGVTGSPSNKMSKDSLSRRYRELVNLCNYYIEKYPNGLGTPELSSIKEKILNKGIFLNNANQVYPGKEFNILISHKNIAKAELSIYKVLNPNSLLASAQNLLLYNTDSLLTTDAQLFDRTQHLFNNNLFAILESESYPLSLKEEGIYILKLDAGNSELSYISRVYCTKLAVLNRKIGSENSLYATNFNTGEPVKEAHISLAQEFKNPLTYSIDSMKVINKELYQFNGFTKVSIPKTISESQNLYYKAEDYGPYTHLFLDRFRSKEVKTKNFSEILLDRSLYRPGDTLFYKIILYNNANGVNVNSNDKAKVLIRDSKGAIIDTNELETNEFGSGWGFFVIDNNTGNGEYSLEVSNSQEGNQYNLYKKRFRVEEYKRDSFYITTQEVLGEHKLGDTITLKGNILSYSGFPMANTQISYTVVAQIMNSNSIRVFSRGFTFGSSFSSTTISDSLGNFTIPVIFTPDSLYKQYNIDMAIFNVEITATSTTSESNTGYAQIFAGELPSSSNISYDNIVCAQVPTKFKVESRNIQGQTKLQGNFKITSEEKRVSEKNKSLKSVISGDFTTWQDIILDLSILKSGSYSFVSSTYGKNGQVEKDSVVFSLFHLNDSTIPNDSKFFFFPLKHKDDSTSIHFMVGTSAEKAYTLVELIGEDSVLYKRVLVIENGLHDFSIDIPICNFNNITLSLTTVIEGELFKKTENYKLAPLGQNKINLNISNLRKKYLPSHNETFTLRIRDNENRSFTSSELLVSIFDKATEKFNPNSFNLQVDSRHDSYFWLNTNSASFGRAEGATLRSKGKFIMAVEDEEEIPFVVGYSSQATVMIRGQGPELKVDSNSEFRKNFKETLLFKPLLYPNSSGDISVSFNTSQLLSTFKVLVLAHDKKLNNTILQNEFIVNKDLMILSNLPAFIREGDLLYAQSMAVNLTADTLKATCKAYVGKDGEPELELRDITLAPGEQKNIEWKLNIPKSEIYLNESEDSLKFRIMLVSSNYSDGEEHIVKVLPSWTGISQVKGYTLDKKGTRKIDLAPAPQLENSLLISSNVTISSPMEILSKELEAMIEPKSKDLFSYLGAIYARAFFKDPSLDQFRKEAFSLFNNLKDKSDFYCWFPGMNGNYYLTYLFLDKIYEICKIGQFEFTNSENELLDKAIKTIDNHFMYQHKLRLLRIEKHKSEFIPTYFAIYLRVRSLYPQFETSDSLKATIDLYLDSFEKSAVRSQVMENAYVAAALYANNRESAASRYLASIKEYAVKNNITGYSFPNAVLPLIGMVNNQITAHSFILNLFTKAGDAQMITGISKWILLQKENQNWDNGLYITDATTALMNAHFLDNNQIQKKTNSKTKYKLDKKRGVITITKKSDTPEFLYVTHNYAQSESSIKSYSNGLSIDRTFYRVVIVEGKEELLEIKEGDTVNPGEVIEIALSIKNSENRSYVVATSALPASFVPVIEKSDFRWGYYREVKSSSISYYFDLLPQGDRLIKERFIVNNKGDFSTGIPKIKSLFAPAFRGNGESSKI